MTDMPHVYDGCGEYGELDEWFSASIPCTENPPPKSKTSIEPLISQLSLPSYYDKNIIENQKVQKPLDVPEVFKVSKDNIVLEKCKMNEDNIQAQQKQPQQKPKLKNHLTTKKHMTPEEHKREIARIHAKKTRERRKLKFQASIEYSKSLQKQNEKLKQQISFLKEKLNELLLLYRQKHCM